MSEGTVSDSNPGRGLSNLLDIFRGLIQSL